MQLPPALELSEEDKLQILQRLDQFRQWRSLDDKRYCLSCGRLLSGRDLRVIGGTRGTGPLTVICATPQCPAIPMDWVLPPAEVLEKKFAGWFRRIAGSRAQDSSAHLSNSAPTAERATYLYELSATCRFGFPW